LAFILIKKKEDPDPFYTTLKSPLSVNEGIRGSRPKAEGRVVGRNKYGRVSHASAKFWLMWQAWLWCKPTPPSLGKTARCANCPFSISKTASGSYGPIFSRF